MSFGADEGADIDFAIARGRDWPCVQQFSVFVENRLGGLLSVVRHFETSKNHILALSVVDSADCAIIRIVLADPERAREIFELAKLSFTESQLLVVKVPETPQPLLAILKTLLLAELNILYTYPLLTGPHGTEAIALRVEDIEAAAQMLQKAGFTLYTEGDLKE